MDGECAAKMVQNTLPGCNPAVTSSAFRGSAHASVAKPLAQNRERGQAGEFAFLECGERGHNDIRGWTGSWRNCLNDNALSLLF